MIRSLQLYWKLISIKIRSQMQYRASFFLDVSTTAFMTGIAFLTLALILEKFGNIAGWTLGEVAFLYGLVEFSFGVMDMVFSGFDPSHFGQGVRRGVFDQLLLRPVNITLQVLGSDFQVRRLGRISQGLLVLAAALALVDVRWTPEKILYLPVVILSLVVFFGGLFIIGSAVTFWTVESVEMMNIFTYGGSEMMSYPMHIYSDWMRRFFTFIIPAIFLNYYPALYFLDKPDPFGLAPNAHFLAPLAGFSILAIGLVLWNFGIRRYQSTGT
jgi:ABC-2 type transport system permease protein